MELPELEVQEPLLTSININLSTLPSLEFLDFDSRIRAQAKKTFIFELQDIDALGITMSQGRHIDVLLQAGAMRAAQ